ncbi:hypothetical protein ColTof3_13324 [Colletotrichum tofieldiae]|nr:hypothetical protein ColTof3_13324 [Colletotrichum tofieldiae]
MVANGVCSGQCSDTLTSRAPMTTRESSTAYQTKVPTLDSLGAVHEQKGSGRRRKSRGPNSGDVAHHVMDGQDGKGASDGIESTRHCDTATLFLAWKLGMRRQMVPFVDPPDRG